MPRKTVAERFWKKVDRSGECWLWTASTDKHGYGRFSAKLAHRVSYELEHGVEPGDLCVCHSCDNPSCVNPDHLWLGTHAENMADCHSKGRVQRGERHAFAKLTAEDAELIRGCEGLLPQRELAQVFGVHQTNIGRAMRAESWRP
jgi:hypothetical protein